MCLITAPHSPPICIVWSSLNTGDWLQQVKENHPNKTDDRASDANPEVCDGAERFGYDFVNTALTSKEKAQEVPGIRVLAC